MTSDPTSASGWEPYDPHYLTGPPAGAGDAFPGGYSGPPPARDPMPPVAASAPAPYAAPGYPPPVYGYPPAYPGPHGGAGQPGPYPAYGYPPYGTGYAPTRTALRPGVVTAACVVGYVLAGLLILCAMGLFTGAKAFTELSDNGFTSEDLSGQFVFDGIANLVAAALLIAGGVQFTARRTLGRAALLVGGGIAFALSVYWIDRLPAVLVFWAFVFAGLSITVLLLGVLPAGRRWLAGGSTPSS